ncbi:PTS N-acetylglucosamine transporter subunit IIBC [Pediococcus inopinatus]|uniref:PTS N-acetylglucosamine transporter subunit IIBC n=1 Tax=Pediococcus inopinatus TaxID=114090 RepID=A0ABZ0Q656_9LACO|nr:PTS N-acetylglucosamine transporter subunit IIBC [Pediococcus inopinatus]AVL00718.1 PTS N-acetylglucosamine transporter subunit IIBC [Pediococcus inopinatus]KRN61517.1 PTS family mannose fructose sorbose porter component IIA [Pediococcus inopinatus]WPC16964.1 PTS N-acetylglucosamine transporter subunit IIBC [Pediococcus inopinatus]WPC19917.1 PTS N-acetylglucosamine transporter subunit IIBC [Pediococcus inopinatus]WPC21617.1 PTS N-acetylglucosamine transporter subunit IIBC [Pediococcus inopi
MKRQLVIASHGKLAEGMKKTLEFIAGQQTQLTVMTAYTDNQPIEEQVKKIMSEFKPDEEVVIFTDMLAGSVNQKFFPYRSRPHTQIVTGMNLPVVLAVTMESTDDYLTSQKMRELIDQARQQLVYVNDINIEADDDDE